MYIETTALRKLLKLDKRIKGVQGGTSASKTISIEQILIDKNQSYKGNDITSITSESYPHLRRGAMRDWLNIMQEHNYFDPSRWNKTDSIYTHETGNMTEFFSLDQPHKVRGPRRKRLFINEANNIPKETFEQLEVRTEEEIWLDWNPTSPFWFHEDLQGQRNDVDFITLTYKDNQGLPESIVKSIEARKGNKNWWRVYGQGLIGEVEGRIYIGWKIVDDIPHEARLERRGLDFGFSQDPAVLVDIYYYNGGYIIDELIYRTGMLNRQIGDVINNQADPNVLTVADSAEPKSIAEMTEYGINIIGAEKGPGSVNQRIRWMQEQKISITKRSTNLIKSYRNYMWKTDKEGKILDVPDHFWSDGMDATGYGMETLRPREDQEEVYTTGNMASTW